MSYQSPTGAMGDQKHYPHEGSAAQTPPSDWKEMLDPKSGKKYWVNHFTKQMSYHPPAASKSPPQPAIDANFKGALGMLSPPRYHVFVCDSAIFLVFGGTQGGFDFAGHRFVAPRRATRTL